MLGKQRAKCQLYLSLLELYDSGKVVQEHDIRLMDILINDPDIRKVIREGIKEACM